MLAATPDNTSRLGLLSVVLRSVDANAGAEISAALKDHVFTILRTAAQITANPTSISASTSPEAIELAFRIQGKPALRQRLEQTAAFDAIQPEVAKEVLQSLQPVAP